MTAHPRQRLNQPVVIPRPPPYVWCPSVRFLTDSSFKVGTQVFVSATNSIPVGANATTPTSLLPITVGSVAPGTPLPVFPDSATVASRKPLVFCLRFSVNPFSLVFSQTVHQADYATILARSQAAAPALPSTVCDAALHSAVAEQCAVLQVSVHRLFFQLQVHDLLVQQYNQLLQSLANLDPVAQ